ncbi:hypothetical protein NGB36_21990 [Streptomyces sp. RB6PN25]|uniref:Pyridoxamine 5'-phosphate oxidase putative domain-containing protein n=1 Tax=Streptomyces humicola TaxID=2953240 RepID=A0ABT1Q1M9_9ACTN|nr:hypothetical protein [Streptomyces humicola]MCQ4083200.1 hypothetical protein [Streptomyces humicola]
MDGEGWAVEFVGKARVAEPGPELHARLGALPGTVNAAPYDPVYLRIEPQFVTRNRLTGVDEPGWGATRDPG